MWICGYCGCSVKCRRSIPTNIFFPLFPSFIESLDGLAIIVSGKYFAALFLDSAILSNPYYVLLRKSGRLVNQPSSPS